LTSRQRTKLLDGRNGICHRVGNDNSFASGETVGFDHPRQFGFFDECDGFLAPLKDAKRSRGHIDPLHDVFGERLATLKACRLLARAKHGITELTQSIGYSCYQWRFGTNHHQIRIY